MEELEGGDDCYHHQIWKRFIRKNLLSYCVPNVFFNTCIPYFSFKDPNAVHLFKGEYCLARFLLPMALLLPFIITFDILKKTIALSEQGGINFMLPDHFTKNKFIFKMATINGLSTLLVILSTMLCLHLSLPENYSFNGKVVAALSGTLAALMSVIFTFWPIKKIRSIQ
ncbi:hypothetical protein [Pedobacter sp. L105]|uniref:hypothetical protein n=1 Tax=Pedobacter sp. L105 TaxID=1641871 RepID=UPI00131C10CD|nr:hypothetical protein [Pedobacter sp. L105]